MKKMKRVIYAVVIALICLAASKAEAQNLLAEANHNPGTTMIKCMFAEAGARLNNDHRAIMWVLYRRAMMGTVIRETGSNDLTDMENVQNIVNNHYSQQEQNLMMAHMALQYCNALLDPPPPRSNHRAWAIRGMSRHWIDRQSNWKPLITMVNDWMRGIRAPDPCTDRTLNGRIAGPAIYFGSYFDWRHRQHWNTHHRILCGTVHNLFADRANP